MHIHSKMAMGIGYTLILGTIMFFLGAKFAPDEIIEMCEGAVNEISNGWK